MLRFYLVPIIGTGTDDDPLVPKYIAAADKAYNAMDYGLRETMLVSVDVTGAEHTQLSGQPDVISVPADIDQEVGGATGAVSSALETLRLPANWVQSTHTYREILRIVAGVFQFAQRMSGLTGQHIHDSGVTLNTAFENMPGVLRTALIDTANDLEYDWSGTTGAITLREILRIFAEAWGSRVFLFGTVEL